jgi:hypothetical protein
MSSESMSRRRVLAGAGAAAVAGAALVLPASPAGAADATDSQGLTGSWLITRTDADGTAKTVVSFAGGGVFLSRDHNPPGPPGYGTWFSGSDNHFVFTFLTSGGGGPGGIFLVKVTGRGALSNQTLSGTYHFVATDPSGAVLSSGDGTFSGPKIKAG